VSDDKSPTVRSILDTMRALSVPACPMPGCGHVAIMASRPSVYEPLPFNLNLTRGTPSEGGSYAAAQCAAEVYARVAREGIRPMIVGPVILRHGPRTIHEQFFVVPCSCVRRRIGIHGRRGTVFYPRHSCERARR